MVTEQGRNNIIALAYIGGFAIVILTFFFNYVQQADKATVSVVNMVQKGVDNVTDAQYTQTNSIVNLSKTQNKQMVLMEEERERDKKNLALFMGTFANQSADQRKDTANQTNFIVNAINEQVNVTKQQINLTKYSQSLSEDRIEVNNRTANALEALVSFLNITGNNSTNATQ